MSARYSRSGSISPRVVLHRNVQFDRNVDAIQPHIEKVLAGEPEEFESQINYRGTKGGFQ